MAATSSFPGAMRESRHGFDASILFKSSLSDFLFGDGNSGVETEVRNGNSCVVEHVHSINSVKGERSSGGLPESREALELSDRLTLSHIP